MGYLWIFFDFFIKGIVFYIFLDILLLITFLSVIREGDNDETKKYICRAAHYGKILWVTELHFDRTSRKFYYLIIAFSVPLRPTGAAKHPAFFERERGRGGKRKLFFS